MLTQDEAELYDRQIRLWGVNAQSRIRQSKVLMLGFNGVASEVAKILILAGIDTLTIVDDQPLQVADSTSNLFCRPSITKENNDKKPFRTHAVQAKLKTLNPLVKVNIENRPILSKTAEEYKGYDLVTLHSFLTIDQINSINEICRDHQIKFYTVIDYGFFGFMFNDLGAKFSFTYEEASVFDENKDSKQTGAEKDPISLGDDAPGDDPDDVGYGSSDDEDDRPKKRRRLKSPEREKVAKTNGTKDDSDTVTKVGELSFAKFRDMISLNNATFSKRTSPVLFTSIALFKFYSLYKHLPRNSDLAQKQEDISKLNDIMNSLKNSTDVPEAVFSKLDKDWLDNIYGSLSPVCAVLGGVAGQDMIRALSNRDVPINNTFSFDGISMNGISHKIGIPNSKALDIEPVVRGCIDLD